MNKATLFIVLHFMIVVCSAQNGFPEYYRFMALYNKADTLYTNGDYSGAAKMYGEAANIQIEKAFQYDYSDIYYTIACCWSLAGKYPLAIANLKLIGTDYHFTDYERLINDSDLIPLHNLKEWGDVKAMIQSNWQEKEKKLKNFKLRTTFTGPSSEVIFQPHSKAMQDFIDNDSLPFISVNESGFRIYFRGNSYAAAHLPEIKTELNKAIKHVLDICEAKEYNRGINIMMVDSAGEMQQLTGFYIHGGMAMSENETVLYVYGTERKTPFNHELFHFVSNDLWGMYSARLLQEGGAVYSETTQLNCIDTIVAGIFKEQKMFTLTDIINRFDDKAKENEVIAYFQSASVFKYLLQKFGTAKLKLLWTQGFDKFQQIFGQSLSDFEAEWKKHIHTVPVPPNFDWEKTALDGC